MNIYSMIIALCSFLFTVMSMAIPKTFMASKAATSLMYKPSEVILPILSRGQLGNEWTFNDLLLNLQTNNVDSATILDNKDFVLTIDKNYGDTILFDNVHAIKTLPAVTETIINKLTEHHITFDIASVDTSTFFDYIPWPVQFLFTYLLFITVVNGARVFLSRNGSGNNNFFNPMNPVESIISMNNELIKSDMINTTFADVAGCNEAKFELTEIVDFLKEPVKFSNAGAKIPSGVLLEGPPGTGKTLLARATAGEADVNFISVSGSQFIEMFVGVGASRVRRLFDTAEENKPCIIFIDEIDAVGRQRGAGFAGGNDEREQTLNQILTNMDGFNKEDGIIVLAATNRADILDSALTRPGRFDRKVTVGLPDTEGRKKIMGVHFRNKKLASDVDFDELSALTSGFSGADIANLANEAAILSVRYNEPYINKKCVTDAFEKITIGLPKEDETREQAVLELVAYHEAGHTAMVKLFNEFFDLRKVTITSNQNGAGGYTLFTPKERYSNYPTKKFMLANLIVALGGRAAEVILYRKENKSNCNYSDTKLFPNVTDLQITTGASNDLKQANSIARRYVSLFGLGKQIGLYDDGDNSQPFLGRDITSGNGNKLSEYTKQAIDKEVEELVQYAYEKAINILEYNNEAFTDLGQMLLDKKVVDSRDLIPIKITYHDTCDNENK